jgi:hypothetical protein
MIRTAYQRFIHRVAREYMRGSNDLNLWRRRAIVEAIRFADEIYGVEGIMSKAAG